LSQNNALHLALGGQKIFPTSQAIENRFKFASTGG
jgi:hypothetical protein